MCLHTAIFVSSYCFVCTLILIGRRDAGRVLEDAGRVLTTVYVSSYCYICVLILLGRRDADRVLAVLRTVEKSGFHMTINYFWLQVYSDFIEALLRLY
jgi:hypothetical protein